MLQQFLDSLGKLNSVANTQGKGRDSFDAEVLIRAMSERSAPSILGNECTQQTTSVLCSEIFDSFGSMRDYLRKVAKQLERVDPHLSNNAGLASRLADWEGCYELGTLYVRRVATLRSLCFWVSELDQARARSAKMSSMLESCDAELFLVLPRLLWLSFLRDPRSHSEVLSALLPSSFTEAKAGLQAAFSVVQWMPSEELLRHVVSGPGSSSMSSVERFLLDLERLSMELQRSNPREWNRISHTAVQCLTGSLRKERSPIFVV
jgi:hypothetical protein